MFIRSGRRSQSDSKGVNIWTGFIQSASRCTRDWSTAVNIGVP